jgi:hypothetical protein
MARQALEAILQMDPSNKEALHNLSILESQQKVK